ncbi:MAG: gliding motility-associated C-terminal domain-containing protein [Robiginitalea sp.]|uniref:Ig-like domain-containing protein n=2 Tax=Robiginitalea sp. TaxID=1902411 RepID=UPI003C757377
MKNNLRHITSRTGLLLLLLLSFQGQAQFLLQAPNSGDEANYRWYEASDPALVIGTDFFYEATQPGIYFATYDGTLCGSNATDYFILTDCNSPDNQVILDIAANVNGAATVTWIPALGGDQLRPQVIASQTVERYTASITKAGNTTELPSFVVVCMQQAAELFDDIFTLNEDTSEVIPIFDNDTYLPQDGALTATDPSNGTISIDDSGTPNDPTDDVLTYTPDPDFNGSDTFDYTVCNTSGDCSTATVTITVLPIVDAIDDAIATLEEQPVILDILANDNDIPNTGTLTVTDPSNGTVSVNDNGTPNDPSDDTLLYTPADDFVGTDTFTYTLCDASGNCSTATVTIIVNMADVDIDSDDDGIVDRFEDLDLDGDNDPATNPVDTDSDGIPDYLDIDSDNDGIPDNVEAQTTGGYLPPLNQDLNSNGLDDAYENGGSVGLIPQDTDGDGLPDYVDTDSDDDGVPDAIEAHDWDRDGFPDVVILGSDQDNDGLDDGYEGSEIIDIDVNDEIDNPNSDLPDTDSDGEADYRDIDDDGDRISTSAEDSNGDGIFSNDDSDRDGIPDYLDPTAEGDGVIVYNAVTPNGDGAYDVLTIENIENFPNNSVRIYNRWGVLVFSTRAYNTQGNTFDGTSEGRATVARDNKLPTGTYFYILEYETPEGVMRQQSGYLYLNR